jgi:hypothetical protein
MFKRVLLLAVLAILAHCYWGGSSMPAIATTAATASTIPSFEFSPRLAPAVDPIQKPLRAVSPLRIEDYVVTPIAKFQVAGRVLGARRYRSGREADVSPIDLAMGWGPMADPEVLSKIEISQSGRFYFWRVDTFPIPAREISRHSANMHLVPANPEVAKKLVGIAQGEEVRFKGYLLQVQADDGWRWRSSTSRDDTGGGACELVLVDAIEVL